MGFLPGRHAASVRADAKSLPARYDAAVAIFSPLCYFIAKNDYFQKKTR
jgi:hypothetical protein